jgi:hypothetical protein
MSKKPIYLFAGALAVVLAALSFGLFSGPAEAEARNRYDIVFVRCDVNAGFRVQAYTGSAAAPSRNSDNCAETISVLNRDGFSVEQVSKFDVEKGFLVYMLVR